jgi:uncharacterized membrane protein SpoIIM required for sporulation
MENKNKDRFKISITDFVWTLRLFLLSVVFAFVLGIVVYIFTLVFAEHAPVSEAIMNTATAATAKVEITSNYISPMWAIFIFNSIAASFAVIGSGLFMSVHHLLIGDIAMRPKHPLYARFSILFEKLIMPLYSLFIRIASMIDRDFSSMRRNHQEKEGTIWQYCGYGKDEYRMFSYMLPYIVPLMILMVNGFLMGILLSFFAFNGALTGFELLGLKGIIIGLVYNVVYFFISIIPHGIIEIPAIILAAAVGYRFGYIQAHDVIDRGLFNGDTITSLKEDAEFTFSVAKDYMLSGYTWKMLGIISLTLLIAAYIETYMTLGIVDKVMHVLDSYVEGLLF